MAIPSAASVGDAKASFVRIDGPGTITLPVNDAHTGTTTYVGNTRISQVANCAPVIDHRALTTSRASARPAPSARPWPIEWPARTPSRPSAATFVVSEGDALTISTLTASAAGKATVVPNAWRCTLASGIRVSRPARARTDLIVSAQAPSMRDMHTGYRLHKTPAAMSSD